MVALRGTIRSRGLFCAATSRWLNGAEAASACAECKSARLGARCRIGKIQTMPTTRAVEDAPCRQEITTIRLDIRCGLAGARQLYARNGCPEVTSFGDGRQATPWFEKALA